MNPTITNLVDENNMLNFTIKDINMSLANALRRVIIAEIPTIIFRTFPHAENKAIIEINTSRFNNEIVKQRLGCIPIHINDKEFPLADYIVEIDVNNQSANIIYATTEDFKIKNILTEKYLSEAANKQIFPPNILTNFYIDFLRLRPKLSEVIPGEQIKMSCPFSIGTAKESGMFNVVSTCSYGATMDPTLIKTKWAEKEKELKAANTPEDIEFIKKDWMLLEAKRLIIPDSFEFIVESVGVYSNFKICNMACNIIIDKIKKLTKTIQEENIISPTINTIQYCYDITLHNEDYTLGKIIEYILYEKYFNNEITFVGFRKSHPHLDYSIIRVAFKDDIDNIGIITYILSACETGIGIFGKLQENFSD